MAEYLNIKKVCNFYVSTIHLTTMIIPFIHKKINLDLNIATLLEYNLSENINTLLSKLILNNEEKNKIINIGWKSTNLNKYIEIEKRLKETIKNTKQIIIIVVGDEKRINYANECIEKYLKKHSKKIGNRKITIIDCYEVTEFNNNIIEILNSHEYILNTSGEYKIDEYMGTEISKRESAID